MDNSGLFNTFLMCGSQHCSWPQGGKQGSGRSYPSPIPSALLNHQIRFLKLATKVYFFIRSLPLIRLTTRVHLSKC